MPQIIIGVDSVTADATIRLKVENPGPAYVHFPKLADGTPAVGFTDEYFKQLTSEYRGMPREEWRLDIGKRNEALDCFIYASAALENYCGFTKPADTLERIAKERFEAKPEESPKQFFGPLKPTPQPVTKPEAGKSLPRWMTNRRK